MEEELKIALIGCGNWVYDVIYECTKHLPVKLIAICDLKEERLQKFAERYHVTKVYRDYKDLLRKEELDAVICFPDDTHMHYSIAKDCLLSGVNVFIERPQCLNIEQAKDLISIQERMSKYVMARLNKRFTPAYMMAKEIIQREEFGRVTMYMAKYHAPEYESEPSFIFKHIIHHLDLARYLLGEIVLTHVDTIKISDTRIGYQICFVTANDSIGVIQTGSLQSAGYPMERVEITGVGKNVIVDNIKSVEYNREAPKRNAEQVGALSDGGDSLFWNMGHGNNSNFTYHGFENQLHQFVNSLLQKKPPFPHMEDSIHTNELLDKFVSMLNN